MMGLMFEVVSSSHDIEYTLRADGEFFLSLD